jgi:drug/metabolite transporter (DMT)-like permease
VSKLRVMLFVLGTSACAVAAQVFLKAAITSVQVGPSSGMPSIRKALALILSAQFMLAMLFIGLAGVLWIILLAQGAQISSTFPLLGFSSVFVVLIAHFRFGEPLTIPKVVGTLLIVIGAVVLTREWGGTS